ncbi:MAG TPA: hypothetical protein VKQ71_00765 [Acidimicrobiales bacterium]|nr:hypothetical protein [Acidimicrobiales bacterium]
MAPSRVTVSRVHLEATGYASVAHGVDPASCPAAVEALGLAHPSPVIVVNGGTAVLPPPLESSLVSVMSTVVDMALRTGSILVTGGTDAGIFMLLGRQATAAAAAPVMVGIAPESLVTWPGRPRPLSGAASLEPHHSHFVLTPGRTWGDEVPTMLAFVTAVAGPRPTMAVIVGGGDVTRIELAGHLAARRPVVVLRGSGRLADETADGAAGTTAAATSDAANGVDIGASGVPPPAVTVIDIAEGGPGLRDAMTTVFGEPRRPARAGSEPRRRGGGGAVREGDGDEDHDGNHADDGGDDRPRSGPP